MKQGAIRVSDSLKANCVGAMATQHGTQALYDRRNADRILEVIDANGFTAATVGLEERGGDRYTRERALEWLAEPPIEFEQTTLILRQNRPNKYLAGLNLWRRAQVWFEFDKQQPAGTWPRVFELAEALASAFEPDWGAASLKIDLRDDRTRAFANEEERDLYLLSNAGNPMFKDYNRHGPHGLAMRTHIGPFFVEQFGRDRIESLPLVVERLPWGGYRIDLVPEPWAADVPALLDAWRRGMAHLRDAKVFATPEMAPSYAVHWTRGANARLRRDG
jgi:hypothetical protein